jgi:glycogen operon protein
VIQQDPVISQMKLIAEPWDVGEGGYQVGNFPPLWSEWNGQYRDTVRDYWRGDPETLSTMASRLTGSSDLYEASGRRPFASVNFVTAHDGFTLRDLVSYNEKHNEANGEGNRDGESHNRSWNCGVDGPTDDLEVNRLRARQQRNFLATLLLSQGIPMLLGGDEIGRTQRGNNNAYCQDDEISWFNWEAMDGDLLLFAQHLIAIRREHYIFRRRRWFQGRSLRGAGVADIVWYQPDGSTMTDEDWQSGFAKSLGVFLSGQDIPSRGRRGERHEDDDFYLVLNAHHDAVRFRLPAGGRVRGWRRIVDTNDAVPRHDDVVVEAEIVAGARSLLLLRHEP